MTHDVASTAPPGPALVDRETPRDDAALRRSLAPILGSSEPTSESRPGSVRGSSTGAVETSAGSIPRGRRAGGSRAVMAAIVTLLALGSFLLLAGVVLLVDDLSGRHAFDLARLASLWPAVLAVFGALTVANGLALVGLATATPRVPADEDEVTGPNAATTPASPVPAAGRPPREVAEQAGTGTGTAWVAHRPFTMPPPEPPSPVPPQRAPGTSPVGEPRGPERASPTSETQRPAPDALAALLELQALRRNRLISKKQYRAKRRALAAGLAPRFAGPAWSGDEAYPPAAATSGRPLAYWGPTAE